MLENCFGNDSLKITVVCQREPLKIGRNSIKYDGHFLQSKMKKMLTVFMDYIGVVSHEFLPGGQTANRNFYLGVMRSLLEAILRKRLENPR